MCGIAGIVGNEASSHRLERMLEAQAHRGPDNTGRWIQTGEVAMGHNRLSIIDLTEAANQPFHSHDSRFVLVFNGEIYNYLEVRDKLKANYIFKTQSDTEVLLNAYLHWGEACLDEFNGMFAFAIWDREKKELFAARDRFGVKPFYYALLGNSIFFSSEIPALFGSGVDRAPKESVWSSYFAYGSYGLPHETFWKGIHQLPGGHYLRWQEGGLTTTRWYDFEQRVRELQHWQPADQEEYITDLLIDSIRLRFRADVPVGFNLSGGLDSSALLALVNHIFPDDSQKIEAFTFYTGNPRYDELPWVEKMLEGRAFPLNKCLLSYHDVPALAEEVSRIHMEPFGGIPTLAYGCTFKRARERGVIVLLDGQGADEAWAGYDYYLNGSGNIIQGVSKPPFRPDVLLPDFRALAQRPSYPQPFGDKVLDLQFRDLFYTKIPRALRFNDRMSMQYGTELREPFLDFRLVEFVFSRPLDFKIREGVQKWLFRKIASRFLSNEVTTAPKRPLQTPQREWLGKELEEWASAKTGQLADLTSWFDGKSISKELETYRKGDQDSSFHIWQWVNSAMILSK